MSEPDTDAIPAPNAEFIEHVTQVQRSLHAFILSLVRNTSDAEDILQEVNLVLWRKSNEFKQGTNFDAWAFRIAQFQVMAFRKKQQRSRLQFDDDLVEILATEASKDLSQKNHAIQNALSHCLEKLKPEHRKLIAKRYEPDGCVKNIATSIGRSPKAVSEQLRRIRQTLADCIERTLDRKEATS